MVLKDDDLCFMIHDHKICLNHLQTMAFDNDPSSPRSRLPRQDNGGIQVEPVPMRASPRQPNLVQPLNPCTRLFSFSSLPKTW